MKLIIKAVLVFSLSIANSVPASASQTVGAQIGQDLNSIFSLIKTFNDNSNAINENSSMEDLRSSPARESEIFSKLRVTLNHYNRVITTNWSRLPNKNTAQFPARETLLGIYTQTINWVNVASVQEAFIFTTFKECYLLESFAAYSQCIADFPNSESIIKTSNDKQTTASQKMAKPVNNYINWTKSFKAH